MLAGSASLVHGRIPPRLERITAIGSAVIIGTLALKIVADTLT